MHSRRVSLKRWLIALALFPVLMLLVPVLLLAVVARFLVVVVVYLAIWVWWLPRGRNVLFVYSNSPIWQDYIEEKILPRLGKRAAVLNWSERKTWRRSLAVAAFRALGGRHEFNPMAIVFRPFWKAKYFRFYYPFRDFKHGKSDGLEMLQRQFLECINVVAAPHSI